MRLAAPLAVALALAGCGRGKSGATPGVDAGTCSKPYPAAPYGTTVGSTLRDYAWPGLAADGTSRTVAVHDHLDACASTATLLVVRIAASWCGTCRWHAGHSKVLASSDVGGRVKVFDVLLRGQDNAPAAPTDAASWRALQDQPADIAIDPGGVVSELMPPQAFLPYVLLVDARDMRLVDALSMPTEDGFEAHVRSALATADGIGPPAVPPSALVDGRFSRDQWDLVTAMSLHDPPPHDTTDSAADSLGASELGRLLFNDVTLSPSAMVACASCHEAAVQFTDGRPTSPEGVGNVPRNAPSLDLVAYQPWQFWDGRADSLWSQALAPMESPHEFGSSRLFVAHVVWATYKPEFEHIFGPLPALDDLRRFPPSGKPGDPSWASMATADQEAATRVFVSVGKAIEAFERSLRGTPIALDQYAAGDATALTDAQKDGLSAFLTAGCVQCHWGPRLTDDSFHVLRFPTGRQDLAPDRGRIDGIAQYAMGEFSAGSVYSDDPSLARTPPASGPWALGAFKTPGLRSVALTAPYGHGGNYIYLSDVIELHRTGGLPAGSALTIGDTEPWLAPFDQAEDAPILSFLQALAMSFSR
jgi:cytochrome c peroxidase